jgi:type VI secretion system protein ImpE
VNAEELIRAGKVNEALQSLQEAVREDAANPKLRVFLFQLLCIQGKWERALTQLQLLANIDADTMLLAQIFQPVIQCETLRVEIFAGKRTPLIFGEPMEWIGLLIQSGHLAAQGNFKSAVALRDRAFDAAPATGGHIGDREFSWIADADSRLGPILEVILEGRYYWVPFARIKSVRMEAPQDLRDLIWRPAQFIWANGGQAAGHVPVRYPGTEASADGQLLLARKTEWIEHPTGYCTGLGQRMLATDEEDHSLLECKTIELSPAQ